jgi:hypothetical protein
MGRLARLRDKPGTMAEFESLVTEMTHAPDMPEPLVQLIQSVAMDSLSGS